LFTIFICARVLHAASMTFIIEASQFVKMVKPMFSFSQLLTSAKTCSCGHTHTIATRDIRVEAGLIDRLPLLFGRLVFTCPIVICDDNTEGIVGRKISALLGCLRVTLPSKGLHATEKAVALAEDALHALPVPDCLIAVGSGTIHDITRYVAHKMNIDFISVPTAASVDGFVSTVAAMTWYGVKTTLPARAPIAVYADTDIIAAAPARLTASGFGDMVGKYIALADWRIAHLLTGEPLCEEVFALEEEAVRQAVGSIKGLRKSEAEGCRVLMEGLLLSGIAMQMVGNSRPASGAEHHISHYVEMMIEKETPDFLHGEKVGAAAVVLSELYRGFADHPTAINAPSVPTHALLESVFGSLTAGVETENKNNASFLVDPSHFEALLPKICDVLRQIPPAEELKSLLESLGCPTTLGEIGVSAGAESRLLRFAPYVRARLTMLRIMADFGLLK